MSRFLQGVVGLAVAAVLLWVLFRGTEWEPLREAIVGIDLGWLLVSQFLLWATYFTRVQRWAYVVRAAHPASFRHLLSASQIGVLMNYTVPGRVGEFARTWVLARLAGLRLSRAAATVLVDRVSDVTGLLSVLFVAGLAIAGNADFVFPPGSFGNVEPVPLSDRVVRAASWGVAALAGVGALALYVLYAHRERVLALTRRSVGMVSRTLAERVAGLLASFSEGLQVFGSRSDLARSLFWSLATWLTEVAAFAAVLEAFGIDYPWHTPFVMLALIAVGVALPVAPGTVGQFHVAAVAGLLLAAPHVEPTRAKAVAIVDHASSLLPGVLLGLFCLYRERLGFLTVVRESAEVEEKEAPTEP